MNNDMTSGSIFKSLLRFTLPLIFSGLLQQMYSIADALIVGNFAGQDALAAVGCSMPIQNVFIFVISGLVTGCTIQTSYYFGSKDYESLGKVASSFSIIITAASCFFAAGGVILCGPVLELMNTDPSLMPMAESYTAIILAGVPFVCFYNIAGSVMRGVGDSRNPLYALIIASVVNVSLDLLFVAVFKWGVAGAAVATLISQIFSALYLLVAMRAKLRSLGSKIGRDQIDMPLFWTALKLSVPKVIQSSMMSTGSLLLQNVLNSFGVDMVRAITAAYKTDMLLILPVLNGAIALSIFTGQNLGAGNVRRAKEGFLKGSGMIIAFAVVCAAMIWLFGDNIIGFFGVDDKAVYLGYRFLRTTCLFYPLMGAYEAFSGYLQGHKRVVFTSVCYIGALTIRVSSSYIFAGTVGTDIVAWSEIAGWIFGLCVCGARCIALNRKLKGEPAEAIEQS